MSNLVSKFRTRKQEDSEELVPLERSKKVKVIVCSSSHSNNVEGLIQHIRRYSDVVEAVRFEQLPYNISDMSKWDLSGIDVLLLCHSIENRRFSITNVTDALYDGFLPRARNYLGRSKVGVIAHDFPESDLSPEKLSSRMESFRRSQSTTFKCASLVLIGGQLISDDPILLTDGQQEELHQFFADASSPPLEEIVQANFYRVILSIMPYLCCFAWQ